MSVVGTEIAQGLPWGGLPGNNSLPTGTWEGQASVLGDATGGVTDLLILFQDGSAGQLDSNMYSLEQVNVTQIGGTVSSVSLSTTNLGLAPPARTAGLFDQGWTIAIAAGGGSTRRAMEMFELLRRGVFLGGQQLAGAASGLALVTTNEDGVLYTMNAMGYTWGARSRSAPGGPQRPFPGLW